MKKITNIKNKTEKHFSYSWIKRLSIIRIANFSLSVYKIQLNPTKINLIKIIVRLFSAHGNLILKFIWQGVYGKKAMKFLKYENNQQGTFPTPKNQNV